MWLFNLFVHWDQCFVGKTTYCWDSIWSENLLMTMSIYFCIWPSFTRLLKILNHYALRYLPDIFMMVCDYKHSLKDFAYYGFVTRIWVNFEKRLFKYFYFKFWTTIFHAKPHDDPLWKYSTIIDIWKIIKIHIYKNTFQLKSRHKYQYKQIMLTQLQI